MLVQYKVAFLVAYVNGRVMEIIQPLRTYHFSSFHNSFACHIARKEGVIRRQEGSLLLLFQSEILALAHVKSLQTEINVN